MFQTIFRNRRQAAAELAEKLDELGLPDDTIVLGLARGGVPVSREIADQMQWSHDVFVVRKLGVPFQPELAFGAVATGGVRILNQDVLRAAQLSEATVERVTAQEMEELQRREASYRNGRPPLELSEKTVILADDGMATGATMAVAVEAIQQQNPTSVIAAVPVASHRSIDRLRPRVDELICLATPEPFLGVGAWYRDFSQTSDEEVRALLEK